MMQDKTAAEEQSVQSGKEFDPNEKPHKHNPFEDKRDSLTKEEEEGIEQFKEAQTERD